MSICDPSGVRGWRSNSWKLLYRPLRLCSLVTTFFFRCTTTALTTLWKHLNNAEALTRYGSRWCIVSYLPPFDADPFFAVYLASSLTCPCSTVQALGGIPQIPDQKQQDTSLNFPSHRSIQSPHIPSAPFPAPALREPRTRSNKLLAASPLTTLLVNARGLTRLLRLATLFSSSKSLLPSSGLDGR
jgi:hypothetical protein